MSLLCNLFGHTPVTAYGERDIFFCKILPPDYDGIHRAHRDLYAECDRCGTDFRIGRTIDPQLSGKDRAP